MFVFAKVFTILFIAGFLSCSSTTSQQPEEGNEIGMQKDTCEGPDSDINCCFVNMPASVSSIMSIAGEKEPGERLIISGIVYKKDGTTPYSNVIIYAYHTDTKGIYSKSGKEAGFQKWHGKLHGWCKTDVNGRYEIHTIRPASYPNSTAPAHIHAAIKLPGDQQPFYIKDYVFDDDPFVDESIRSGRQYGEGHPGVVKLRKTNNVWHGVRDLVITME